MVLKLINLDRTFSKTVSEASGNSATNTGDRHLRHLGKEDNNRFSQSNEYTFAKKSAISFFNLTS